MAQNNEEPTGLKHQLLVYRFIAGRYRPVGMALFLIGLIAQLARFVPALQSPRAFLGADDLAKLGIAAMIAGAGIWILTIFMMRQAYVQCQKDYVMIHLMFSHVVFAYQRLNEVKTVKVSHLYDPKKIKGQDKNVIKPLIGETAITAELTDWPLPEKRLRRTLSQFLFDTREQGFLFIVPNPGKLSMELNSFMERSRGRKDEESQRYLDPIERLRHQSR